MKPKAPAGRRPLSSSARLSFTKFRSNTPTL